MDSKTTINLNDSALNCTNLTSIDRLPEDDFDFDTDFPIIVYYCILACIAGVIINLITVFAILHGRHTSSKVKVQLIHLAIADFLFALVYPIYCGTIFLIDDWSITLTQCYVYVFVCKAILSASPLCTAAISLERLIIIYFPFSVQSYRRTHKLMVVALIWFSACLLSIDDVIYIHVSYEQGGEIYCRGGQYDGDGSSSFLSKLIVIDIIIPVTIILASFLLICIRLCIKKKTPGGWKKGIDRILGMMAVDAMTSVVPSFFFYTYIYIFPHNDDQPTSYIQQDILEALHITSAYSMPVIYLIFNQHFRKDLKLMFQRIRCNKTTEMGQSVPKGKRKQTTVFTV
ncbi:somatostatin receptor type 2-like [Watersipora subatra]|uniref:somatostatin receptor type 2-like n=1 Tax=Watersipora subatra TaxID=2589382 RepID=UPI00355C0DD6